MYQRTMGIQQGGWLKCDRHPPKPTRLNPKRTESNYEPIQGRFGGTPTRSIKDQQLMFGQNGFGDDSAQAAEANEPKTVVIR
jgi:hypothetical protein